MRCITGVILAFSLLTGGSKGSSEIQQKWSLCPDLAEIGNGSADWEFHMRCIRVISARFAASGESPADIAAAAIEACDAFGRLYRTEAPDYVDHLRMLFGQRAANIAKLVVVRMRASQCGSKPDLFSGISDKINRPDARDLRPKAMVRFREEAELMQKAGAPSDASKDYIKELAFSILDGVYIYGHS